MKAILLTAGYGTRLKPLTDVLPKCLLPVNGRPLLEYWFAMLADAGITSILMNLHYLPQIMKEWVQLTEYASNIKMVYEESLLGTGGTLFQNRDFVGDEPVMLVHADNLCSVDIKAYINAHESRPPGTEITMMTFNTPTPETCGIVDIDHSGIVRAFHEKVANPPGNLANAAVYIVEPSVMDFLASLNKSAIDFSTEVLPAYLGKIYTFHNANYHRDIGNAESYLAAQTEFSQGSGAGDRKNGWAAWCGKNTNMLDVDFPAALASAYNADIIDSRKLLDGQMEDLISSEAPRGKPRGIFAEPCEARNAIPLCGTCPAVVSRRRRKPQGFLAKKGERVKIISCQYIKNRVEELIRFIESGKLKKTNIIIYFKEVSCGFSSRTLFEKTQLRSVALCAIGSSPIP